MRHHPFSLLLGAPRATVFNFLADIENLPRWAGGYCERIGLSRGRWLGLTVHGELYLEIEADAHTGVIDLHAGEEHERTHLLPLRVIALPGGQTLVHGTFLPASRQHELAFEGQWQVFREDLRRVAARFGGGLVEETIESDWAAIAS